MTVFSSPDLSHVLEFSVVGCSWPAMGERGVSTLSWRYMSASCGRNEGTRRAANFRRPVALSSSPWVVKPMSTQNQSLNPAAARWGCLCASNGKQPSAMQSMPGRQLPHAATGVVHCNDVGLDGGVLAVGDDGWLGVITGE